MGTGSIAFVFSITQNTSAIKGEVSDNAALSASLRAFVESKRTGAGLTCPVTLLKSSERASAAGECTALFESNTLYER